MPVAQFLRNRSSVPASVFPTSQTFFPPSDHKHCRRSVTARLGNSMLSAFDNSKSGLSGDVSGYTAGRTRRTTVARSQSAEQSTLDRPNGGS